jgi:hypothetical protein
LQAKQEQQQRENDRARLTRLEQQWEASRQAAARVAQQRRYEAFWQERIRACDELIAMNRPPRP